MQISVRINHFSSILFIFLTYPNILEFDETTILNMRANFYQGYSEDLFSDIAVFSFGNSGTYQNFLFSSAPEVYLPFFSSDYPFLIEMPFYKNISEEMIWGCQYYNETSSTWTESNCKITAISHGNQTITFKVYHFSMYRLTEIDPSDNPPAPFPRNISICSNSYTPIYILVVTFFIGIVLAPVMNIIDRLSHHAAQNSMEKDSYSSPSHFIVSTERRFTRRDTRRDTSAFSPRGEESAISGKSNSTYKEVVESQEIDLTENSVAQQIAGETDDEKYETETAEVKYELQKLIEGHLALGIIYYCPTFSRITRLFTLIVTITLELLLEGVLFFEFEDITSGSEKATHTLFEDYEWKYFEYTILAMAITIPVEILMVIAFSIDRNKAPQWSAAAVALGVSISIGSVVGVVMLSYDFCHMWSGYWAVSFLWGILIEVFIIETIFMIVRYLAIRNYSPAEESKTKA